MNCASAANPDGDYVESSGKVFADMGAPRAEEAFAKAELVQKITEIIRARRLTQVRAAELRNTSPRILVLARSAV